MLPLPDAFVDKADALVHDRDLVRLVIHMRAGANKCSLIWRETKLSHLLGIVNANIAELLLLPTDTRRTRQRPSRTPGL
jgi:hypothetical protein